MALHARLRWAYPARANSFGLVEATGGSAVPRNPFSLRLIGNVVTRT